jgi:hypothetical protein
MIDPFFGIDLKIRRAHDQLKALSSEIEAFFQLKPYEIETQINPDTLHIFGILRVRHTAPTIWSVVIGEIVHNLRSALDHLIWQLVIKETGAPPTTNKTQFPIFDTLAGYQSRGEPVFLHGVGATAKTLIKAAQPFETGEGHNNPLWHLHELSNWDKHRAIAFAATTRRSAEVEAVVDEVERWFVSVPGPLHDDAELFRVKLKPSAIPFRERIDKVKMKGGFTFHITFEQPAIMAGTQIVAGLGPIFNRVARVIKRIREDIF